MAASDILVRVQELGGSWVPIGTEKSRGIWIDPANFSADADTWGSRQMQAQLRLDPRALQPQLSAFSPTELEIGGIPCWSGRGKESPSQDGDDRSITPTWEGWQYHTDDDVYQLQYIHMALSDWQDVKQGLNTALSVTEYAQSGTVSSNNQGLVVLAIPNTTVVSVGMRVGVYIDLGPDSKAAYASVDYASNGFSTETLYVRGMNAPQFGSQDGGYGFWDAGSVALNVTPGGTITGAFSTPSRYVVIFMYCTSGYTAAQDVWCQLSAIRLFASSAYQSSGQSILVGSTIVKDAIARATLLFSPDTSQITPTTFVIPEYAMSGPQTPRAVATSALAFDDVIPRITVEKQLSIRARPTLPIYEVGEWAGAEFQDASTNSGDEIYSSVLVTGTDAAGAPVSVRRAQTPSFFSPSAIQPSNPTAATNTTGWAATNGTLSRDTGTFDTPPASFKVAIASIGSLGMYTTSWTGGTFVPGQTYRLTFAYKTSGPITAVAVNVVDANGASIGSTTLAAAGGPFIGATITFTPRTTGSPRFQVNADSPISASIWVDSLTLQQGAATLVDRRGFRRTYTLDTNMSLTGAAAAAIGDVFLASHRNTPFKGTLTLNGPGSIRRVRGGQSVTPGELLRNTGELIHFSHLTDPDTGGLGRYGRIASASLTGPWSAQVQIDSTNDNLQALLNRIQINTQQVR